MTQTSFSPQGMNPEDIDQSPQAPLGEAEDFFDYFSGMQDAERKFELKGGQYILFNVMNEGQRTQYQNQTRGSVSIDRKTQKASILPDQARDRKALIENSVTGWRMLRRGRNGIEEVPFSKGEFLKWYNLQNPSIIQDLEEAIRKENKWMTDEVSIEDIDEQIRELQEMREEKLQIEAEKNS